MQGQRAAAQTRQTDMAASSAQPATAAATEPAQPSAAPAGPNLAFDKLVYDFGQVGPGTRHTGTLGFVNSGSGRLEITAVRGCCGTTVKLAEDKKEYAPGERGTIEIQYSAQTRLGPITRQISVESNDPAHRRVAVALKADIVSKVAFSPATVQVSLVDPNAPRPTLTLTSTDGTPFSITSVISSNRFITAQVDPNLKATTFALPLQVDVKKLPGQTSGFIGLVLTHPECARLMVPFTIRMKYRPVPSQIVVFNAVPQQPVQRDLSVVSDVDSNFTIDSIESEKDLVKITSQEKITKGYRLRLEITPPAARGAGGSSVFSDVLHVHVGRQVLDVNVRGISVATRSPAQAGAGQ